MTITRLVGYQVLDSRGRPTVAATVLLSDGTSHTSHIPSGASTGLHEAKELRDHKTPYSEKIFNGKSVFQACANINELIAPKLVGNVANLVAADQLIKTIDPSEDFHTIGANASLAVSIAVAKSQAHTEGKSLARFFQPTGPLQLPMPMVNILSGGAHAKKTMDIQDVLVMAHGATSFREAISWISAIREIATTEGAKLGAPTHLIADEGGLAIPFITIESACDFVSTCITLAGLEVGRDVLIALDVAATQLYFDGSYHLPNANKVHTKNEFIAYIQNLVKNQPIISIEDPFAEDDWDSWNQFMTGIPTNLQVVGDDLYTTNLVRLNRGIRQNSSNSILIKPNQNGLLTNTMQVLKEAKANNLRTVVSARSGETEDSWLADLAVGWGAGQIKVGSTHGSDRTSKWNRLLELEAIEDCEFSKGQPLKS